jgi:hypothetical protein
MRPGGESTENYCRKCGFIPEPGSHYFKCPKCDFSGGWGIRLKKVTG